MRPLAQLHGVFAPEQTGHCRTVGYYVEEPGTPTPVISRPDIDPTFVMVSVGRLAQAFFEGVDRFLIQVFADSAQRPLAEARLNQLILKFRRGSE